MDYTLPTRSPRAVVCYPAIAVTETDNTATTEPAPAKALAH
jgi:hypothetical protein